MRADRLVAIILRLQRHGTQTAGQLAERLEVSERTILRDMDVLSASGIPVYAERGSKGGFRLSDGYRIDLTGMKSPEIRTLFLRGLDGTLSDLGWEQDARSARDKLVSAVSASHREFAEEVSQRFYIDEARWFVKPNNSPFMRFIQDAIWDSFRLRITYEKGNGEVSSRVISPLALVAKAGVWYLIALRNTEFRVYRVNRISNLETLNDPFVRPKSFDLKEFWQEWTTQFMESLPRYEALLWVEKAAIDTFTKQNTFPIEHLDANAPEGFVAVRITYETLEMAEANVLGYNFNVVVVEPNILRESVVKRAQQVLYLAEKLENHLR